MKPIALSTKSSSFIQAQREIIVRITGLATIESLRAKHPETLVDRVIEQCRNKHIERIRVAPANQLNETFQCEIYNDGAEWRNAKSAKITAA